MAAYVRVCKFINENYLHKYRTLKNANPNYVRCTPTFGRRARIRLNLNCAKRNLDVQVAQLLMIR